MVAVLGPTRKGEVGQRGGKKSVPGMTNDSNPWAKQRGSALDHPYKPGFL